MKLYELKEKADFFVSKGYGDDNVLVTLSEPSIGARASTGITGLYPGFDWEHGQIRFSTEKKITSYEKDRDKEMIPITRDCSIGIRSRHLRICPKCDNHLRKDDNYCSRCRQKIKK